MKKRYGILLASLFAGIGLVLMLLIGYVIKLENISMDPLLEKVDIQDPGYLKIPVRILDKNTSEALTFDPLKNKPANISYKLTKPAWLRVRIGHRDQKLLIFRTLLDWTPQKFGQNQLSWDGCDASGNIINNKRAFIYIEANSKMHAQHEKEKCHDLVIKIIDPGITSIPAVNSPVTVKVVIIGDTAYGDTSGYELRYYVDYHLQDRISYPPDKNEFYFSWDIKNLDSGEHLLTVNIDDRHDHIGTAGLKVKIL